jgi:hypothetical protein
MSDRGADTRKTYHHGNLRQALVDATGMATPDEMAVVGVGRDAADISFMTVFGAARMNSQSVSVTRG